VAAQSNLSSSTSRSLNKHIKGQDEGISTILNAISGWEFQHQAGHSEPLVLALTGPTGVGKSETAYRIAEGALAKQRRVGQSAKYLPSGLLMLRGEDYSGGDLEQVCYSQRFSLVSDE
jgi:polynucleotide 5'-kinase involved in rRNA processing